jgi:hypothetical protein
MLLWILAALAALGWGPIVWHFFRAWQVRKNPISLAICILILFSTYVDLMLILQVDGVLAGRISAWLMFGFSLLTCVNFHLSFFWSKRLFEPRKTRHKE